MTTTDLELAKPEAVLSDDDLRIIENFLTVLKDVGIQTGLNLAITKSLGTANAAELLGHALMDLFKCTTDPENMPGPFGGGSDNPVPDYPAKIVEAAPSMKILADAMRQADFLSEDFVPSTALVNICMQEFFRLQRLMVVNNKNDD